MIIEFHGDMYFLKGLFIQHSLNVVMRVMPLLGTWPIFNISSVKCFHSQPRFCSFLLSHLHGHHDNAHFLAEIIKPISFLMMTRVSVLQIRCDFAAGARRNSVDGSRNRVSLKQGSSTEMETCDCTQKGARPVRMSLGILTDLAIK